MADKKKDGGKGWLVILFLISGFVLLGMVATNSPDTPTAQTAEEKAAVEARAASLKVLDAMIRCENETKSRLADSDGFETVPYGEWRGLPDEVGEGYTFDFKAKAKNAVGGMIWGNFICHVTYDGKYWSVQDIRQQ